MCPLKIVPLQPSDWWVLIKYFSFLLLVVRGNSWGLWHSHPPLPRPTSVRSQMSLGSREAPSTRHPRTQKPPGNLTRRKLSDQIKFSSLAGESGNSKTRILSPRGGEYTSPGVKSACSFNPGPYHCRAYLGLLGWHHWHSCPLPEAREDRGFHPSSSFPSLTQLMSTGLEGGGGDCQPLPVH